MVKLIDNIENNVENLIIDELEKVEKIQGEIHMKQNKILKLAVVSLALISTVLFLNLASLFILLFICLEKVV